jgi:tetratricopeptide (TPR) repeat protein
MRIWMLLVVVAVVARLGTAHADDKAEARKHVEAADISYKLGDFTHALEEYTKAYQLFAAPPLLFNIGQCHRELKQFEKALFFYEGFLRDSPADAPNRSLVEGLAAEMRIASAKQQADQTAAAAEQARAVEESRKRADDEARRRADEDAHRKAEEDARHDRAIAEAKRADEAREREQQDKFYRKWWFWTAVGGAVVLGGTAYYFSGSTTFVEPTGSVGGLDRR